jgi:hypothetical protein
VSDDDDILLRDAFEQLTDVARPAIRPAGIGAARARAVQRRNRVVVVTLAVVLVLALPIGLFLHGLRRGAPAVTPGQSGVVTESPTPAPSMTPSRFPTLAPSTVPSSH